ncbi:hypothetical protein [Streptomyces sp. NPDC057199]|uniref:hypothetical protein n=1 Tax=Streptomyces sp. NPDC057199 TaxID=3346047 RepID=UPI00362634A2
MVAGPIVCGIGDSPNQSSSAAHPNAVSNGRVPQAMVFSVWMQPLGCDIVPELQPKAKGSSGFAAGPSSAAAATGSMSVSSGSNAVVPAGVHDRYSAYEIQRFSKVAAITTSMPASVPVTA